MQNEAKDLGPRTKLLARRVIRLYVTVPKAEVVAHVLGQPGLRSGRSVGAHYRAARRGRSKAELISKIGAGLNEADELVAIFTTISKRAGATVNPCCMPDSDC